MCVSIKICYSLWLELFFLFRSIIIQWPTLNIELSARFPESRIIERQKGIYIIVPGVPQETTKVRGGAPQRAHSPIRQKRSMCIKIIIRSRAILIQLYVYARVRLKHFTRRMRSRTTPRLVCCPITAVFVLVLHTHTRTLPSPCSYHTTRN